MNKQEAIERIENIGTLNIYDKVAGQQVDLVIKNEVLDIVSRINEPQKVVVPKFVAEWLEYCKHDKFYALHGAYANMDEELKCWRFIGNNSDLFAKAWLDGYEIEKEKLYTVQIPNPNSNWKYTFLIKKDNRGVIIFRTDNDCWKQNKNNQLTEAEIRKDFEWAWNAGFAKEVEEWVGQ